MRRYLLFGSGRYYPEGGAEDFISDHDTTEAAQAAEREWRKQNTDLSRPWAHIFDLEARRIILYRHDTDDWARSEAV